MLQDVVVQSLQLNHLLLRRQQLHSHVCSIVTSHALGWKILSLAGANFPDAEWLIREELVLRDFSSALVSNVLLQLLGAQLLQLHDLLRFPVNPIVRV